MVFGWRMMALLLGFFKVVWGVLWFWWKKQGPLDVLLDGVKQAIEAYDSGNVSRQHLSH